MDGLYNKTMVIPASKSRERTISTHLWQVLQLLQDKFKDLNTTEIAADNLYEACVVFAQVADTADE